MMTKPQDTYANWLERRATAPDMLTKKLDSLYSAGPSKHVTQLATQTLQARLASALNPIFYDRLDETTLGPVWVAVGSKGLVAIEYNGSEDAFLNYLAKVASGQPRRSAEQVGAAKDQVHAYLAGKASQLDLPVDLSGTTPFQRRVLEETRRVPRGSVSTYAEIARRIGKPKAARAVGQALRRNPIPIVVPCHRVIASDGSLGGYGGNLRDRRKIELLRLEGATLG
jgi:methylated-DNA-[protein]-cysteine S-methyltransferase